MPSASIAVASQPVDRRTSFAILAIIVLGFALRLAGAQGGLWLDEAWSMMLARDVGTPAGVLWSINHDNNHHLNSLWLQAVGMEAPSWLMRLPSVMTGTLAIPVAAAIARPRGGTAMIVAALLFAISPMLVTMGSEARGYAPMALALLGAVLVVDRVLNGDDRFHRPLTLALCFVFGAMAQLTMVFGVLAVCGWAFLTWWRRGSFGEAVRCSLALFAVPLLALLGSFAVAAYASPIGFQFGFYEPFTFMLWLHALVEMIGYTVGVPWVSIALPIAALVLLVLAPRAGVTLIDFYRLAIFAFPVVLAILQAGNPGHPRYYLLASIALLLMLGEMIANGLASGGRRRAVTATALAAFTIAGLVHDVDLAINRRGDPAEAVRAIARLSPGGADVVSDRLTGRAMLEVAAAQQGYDLRLVEHTCPARRFVFLDRYKGEPAPTRFIRCGVEYRIAAEALAHGLSGTHWTLYRRPF